MNTAELAFAAWAIADGWEPMNRGWPDFVCRRGDEVMAVEVKYSDDLRPEQVACLVMLSTHGIPTFVWRPPGPLEPFGTAAGGLSTAYGLSRQLAEADEEIRRLEGQVVQAQGRSYLAATERSALITQVGALRRDLAYVLGIAERVRPRTNQLGRILARYPELAKGVRPGLRRPVRDDSMSVSMSDERVDAA